MPGKLFMLHFVPQVTIQLPPILFTQPVGCDGMLGSPAREDSCRICNGDGTSCNTVKGSFDSSNLQVGYNDILLIPPGATNIRIKERQASNNYLGKNEFPIRIDSELMFFIIELFIPTAIRNTTGHYYLNGNWRIDFPSALEFAGCTFHYERTPSGFFSPELIRALGPTVEGVFIVVCTHRSI
jgi:hypothetical protein